MKYLIAAIFFLGTSLAIVSDERPKPKEPSTDFPFQFGTWKPEVGPRDPHMTRIRCRHPRE